MTTRNIRIILHVLTVYEHDASAAAVGAVRVDAGLSGLLGGRAGDGDGRRAAGAEAEHGAEAAAAVSGSGRRPVLLHPQAGPAHCDGQGHVEITNQPTVVGYHLIGPQSP